MPLGLPPVLALLPPLAVPAAGMPATDGSAPLPFIMTPPEPDELPPAPLVWVAPVPAPPLCELPGLPPCEGCSKPPAPASSLQRVLPALRPSQAQSEKNARTNPLPNFTLPLERCAPRI